MVETGQLKAPSDWQTERNPWNVAVLGKLGEEVNELGKIQNRCIIQGVDGCDPATGKPNLDALFEEMADVFAMIVLAERHFNRQIDMRRVDEKVAHKLEWLKLIRESEQIGPLQCKHGHQASHWTEDAGGKVVWSCCGQPVE